MENQKKVKGFQWNPSSEVTVKLTGGQVQYVTQLFELFRPLEALSANIMKAMQEQNLLTPMYEEDSVEQIIQSNPPGQLVDVNGESLSSETNKTDEAIPQKAPTMTVV